ncbi:MAG: DUF4424 family protein [Armatimonadota bacterium]|nr:DUF4424 family protein [Armatimonadota bacterium]
MKRIVSLVFMLVPTLYASANDTAVRGISGSVAAMAHHPSICMVSENVSAKIGWDTANVCCQFVFKNEGKTTSVKMGFPEEASGDVSPIKRPAFKSFRSWVDGKPVNTRFIPSRGSESDDLEYTAWHVKDVAFAAGQTRLVVNKYEAPLGMDSMGGKIFRYILKTGKNWKGNINYAKIAVDVSEPLGFYSIVASPEGYVQRAGKVIWVFNNFEPNEDVFIRLEPRVKATLNGSPVFPIDPAGFVRTGVFMAMACEIPAKVSWKPETRECTIAIGSHNLRIRVGSKEAVLDEVEQIRLSSAPYIDDDRLVIPIVEVVKLLGGSAVWDSVNKTIKMTIGT